MTQEEKQLLLVDLCARLPYGVKCCDFCYNDEGGIINTVEILECIYPSTMEYKYKYVDAKHDIERIKPYLRPISSMTEKEITQEDNTVLKYLQDFYNKHYLDYRGLIPMGLALEAPEGMYNAKTD